MKIQIDFGKFCVFSYETADKDDSNQLPKAGFKKVGNEDLRENEIQVKCSRCLGMF